ncbi:unnamed protein product [Cochlearia groenlandica]
MKEAKNGVQRKRSETFLMKLVKNKAEKGEEFMGEVNTKLSLSAKVPRRTKPPQSTNPSRLKYQQDTRPKSLGTKKNHHLAKCTWENAKVSQDKETDNQYDQSALTILGLATIKFKAKYLLLGLSIYQELSQKTPNQPCSNCTKDKAARPHEEVKGLKPNATPRDHQSIIPLQTKGCP